MRYLYEIFDYIPYAFGICDIYSVYGVGVNILQKVNALPHEKMDSFNDNVICVLKRMEITLYSHIRCYTGEIQKCHWPKLHQAIAEIECKKTFLNVCVLNEKLSAVKTRTKEKESKCTNSEIRQVTLDNLKCLVNRLEDNLSKNVFDETDKVKINLTRIVTDLKSIAKSLKLHGHCMVDNYTE